MDYGVLNDGIYICFMLPMLLSLFVLEKHARLIVSYILIGATVCLMAAEINGALYAYLGADMLYFTTTVSPITEEVIKALPVLFFAFFISDKRELLIQLAFATGLGFATLENMILFIQNIDDVVISWSVIRGIGAGLMHGVCTMAIGIGISFVRKRRKLFYSGTLALLMLAIIYHAVYNTLVMSEYKYLGFALPLLTYVPILIIRFRHGRKIRKNLSGVLHR